MQGEIDKSARILISLYNIKKKNYISTQIYKIFVGYTNYKDNFIFTDYIIFNSEAFHFLLKVLVIFLEIYK